MIRIPRSLFDEMIVHTRSEAPNECCGLLGGKEDQVLRIYPVRNLPSDDPMIEQLKVPSDRRFRYIMDPKEQLQVHKRMREEKVEMVGIYHSHPHSPAYPSATDVRLAVYPDVRYFIVSLEEPARPQVRAFRIVEGKTTEESIEISP